MSISAEHRPIVLTHTDVSCGTDIPGSQEPACHEVCICQTSLHCPQACRVPDGLVDIPGGIPYSPVADSDATVLRLVYSVCFLHGESGLPS